MTLDVHKILMVSLMKSEKSIGTLLHPVFWLPLCRQKTVARSGLSSAPQGSLKKTKLKLNHWWRICLLILESIHQPSSLIPIYHSKSLLICFPYPLQCLVCSAPPLFCPTVSSSNASILPYSPLSSCGVFFYSSRSLSHHHHRHPPTLTFPG